MTVFFLVLVSLLLLGERKSFRTTLCIENREGHPYVKMSYGGKLENEDDF